MITVSNIDFSGEIGSLITDSNGKIPSKVLAGSNTIDKDGSGNGVFFIDSAESGLVMSLDMISEPITSDTDLLDKDFEIVFTDLIYTCSGTVWVVIPFSFGDLLGAGSGYFLQSVLTDGNFWLFKAVGGVPGIANRYDYPSGYVFTDLHTYKVKRIAGVISFYVDEVECNKSLSNLDGHTWDSYEGTGIIGLGNLYDVGRDLTLTVGNFKIDVGSTETAAGQPFIKRFGGVPYAALNRGVF